MKTKLVVLLQSMPMHKQYLFIKKIGFEFLSNLDEGEATRLMFLDLATFIDDNRI